MDSKRLIASSKANSEPADSAPLGACTGFAIREQRSGIEGCSSRPIILIAKQLLELFARACFPWVDLVFCSKRSACEFEILTEIADVFVENRLGAAVTTLMS